MTKRMLIDASHPEETRLVVLDGNRIEDFDVEAADRLPLKGNIYLAKVVRVEPSLQAAFVEYGGNRHGFLAFSEIHPDYYQIPVADRQRLLEMQAQDDEEEDNEAEVDTAAERLAPADDRDLAGQHEAAEPVFDSLTGTSQAEEAPVLSTEGSALAGAGTEAAAPSGDAPGQPAAAVEPPQAAAALPASEDVAAEAPRQVFGEPSPEVPEHPAGAAPEAGPDSGADPAATGGRAQPMSMHVDRVAEGDAPPRGQIAETVEADEPPPETLGDEGENGEGEERVRERRIPSRFLRNYKIQEVIRRRQIMLVQVVKEERGNKGAALTTYISLAGRFSVLMPNSPRGGGVSRKITQVADRKRLREAVEEMHLPKGMSIIVRTAGAQRPKPEIKRDGDYLLRLWDDIRERTMASTAPALVYEEADLIKRSIRDTYGRDIEDIEVEGEEAWKQARDFMRMIMPTHEKRVRLYRDPAVPLFARAGVEQQLDAMMSPVVQLKSGGYIVINQTEALVAIDVNSGRATRDRHIEDTAFRTNCEAAEEIGRQLRLRDLAGLIVIDFIDMESSRNDAAVERKLKDALRLDRARIQIGRISHFGLLEMSRQRLRPSLTEHAFSTCPHCQGRGIVRSLESSALHVLRAIEEEGAKRRAAEITVRAAEPVALHILNRKRDRLTAIEARHAMCVLLVPDRELAEANLRIERTRAQVATNVPIAPNRAPALRMDYAPESTQDWEEPEEEAAPVAPAPAAVRAEEPAKEARAEDSAESRSAEGRRRRRRRRGGRREDGTAAEAANGQGASDEGEDEEETGPEEEDATPAAEDTPTGEAPVGEAAIMEAAAGEVPAEDAAGERAGEEPRNRRRGRRGGRRRQEEGLSATGAATPSEEPEAAAMPPQPTAPRYSGPTPADPFAGTYDDVFDAMAAAEAAAEAAAQRATRGDAAVSSRGAPPVAEASPAAGGWADATPDAEPAAASPAAEAPVTAEGPGAEAEIPEVAAAAAPESAAPESTAPEATAPEAATPEGAAPEAAAPAPAETVTEPATTADQPEPAAAPATPAEPVAGPVVQPVLLDGAPADAAPRRRGWWKR
ncbi:Rne/Rng family ribonuclease [Roseomonas sp. BN140053]|uniref:ribonuclease E/G n=1 Tax=Roseomonas sp. BN140053 TaxID=3391898 RepID=UPI0039EB9817